MPLPINKGGGVLSQEVEVFVPLLFFALIAAVLIVPTLLRGNASLNAPRQL